MLSFIGEPNANGNIRLGQEPAVKEDTFTTHDGTEYTVRAQVLTPGQYPKIIKFRLASGQGLLHFRYTGNDSLLLDDEFLIKSGFELLKNAAEVVQLGSAEFYKMYSTEKNLPSLDILKFQIPTFIHDKQKVRLIMDNDVTYVGYFESHTDVTAVFVTTTDLRITIPLSKVVDIQIL